MLTFHVSSRGISTASEYVPKPPMTHLNMMLRSAAYLRQTILLSAYETPETRSLFNSSLKNVAGKIRTERRWAPVEVPEGIDQVFALVQAQRPSGSQDGQNFVQFDCSTPKDEPEKRFQYFSTQVCIIL